MEKLVAMLRAAGDPTRLRLLLLLRQAELTVSELTEIVGQSQPRVSRHLKLLCDAGLLERFKEVGQQSPGEQQHGVGEVVGIHHPLQRTYARMEVGAYPVRAEVDDRRIDLRDEHGQA